VTASGAPSIVLSTTPSWDARNCTGPEIYNPYYGTATSPTRPGYVAGFDDWFQTITMGPPTNGTLMPAVSATEEGAQEALRLVQQYVPDAKIVDYMVTGQVGDQVSHAIELPDGQMLNAGLVLDSYYHQGCGWIPTPTPCCASSWTCRPTLSRCRQPSRLLKNPFPGPRGQAKACPTRAVNDLRHYVG